MGICKSIVGGGVIHRHEDFLLFMLLDAVPAVVLVTT